MWIWVSKLKMPSCMLIFFTQNYMHINDRIKTRLHSARAIHFLIKCISFSLTRHWKSFLTIRVTKNTIQSFDGIRALSMSWVVLGHSLYVPFVMLSISNPLIVMNGKWKIIVYHFNCFYLSISWEKVHKW